MKESTGTITTTYRQRIDRLMWRPAIVHMLLCLGVGLFTGGWFLAVGVIVLAAGATALVTRLAPGTIASAIAMAAQFMTLSALLIEQTGGLVEAHFSIFIMLSALILYCDWRVNVAGAAIIAVHHAVFTYLQYLGVVELYAQSAQIPADPAMLLACLGMHAGAVVGQAIVLVYLAESLRRQVVDSLDIQAFAERAERGGLDHMFSPARLARPAIAAVARLQTRLSGVLADARKAAHAIRRLGGDTAQAQQQLQSQAERSGEQIERIVSSAEQLSSTTRQSAAEAERTRELALTVGGALDQSAQSVQRLDDTMARVDESARDIARLLGEIDEISFQTNLLALNASVEAARAGEQGRGFAVVAGEVRALSQRSTAIAKAIRDRVERSIGHVETGVADVESAAQRMQEVVAVFEQIQMRMLEISTSSQQQHQGIEILNEGILAMQQALALSAQSIESTREVADRLNHEADMLGEAIGYFRIETAASTDTAGPAGPRERRHRQRPPTESVTESVRQGVLPT